MFFEVRPGSPSINPPCWARLSSHLFYLDLPVCPLPSPHSIRPFIHPLLLHIVSIPGIITTAPCWASYTRQSSLFLRGGPSMAGWRRRWWKGWEEWWRCCQEERDVALQDGRSSSSLWDSSVRRNDCSALGWDEWRPYRHIHRQSVQLCKWSCTHWFIAGRTV